MIALLALVPRFLPLIFAIGFLAPLIAQSLTTIGWVPPFGTAPFSFAVAVSWGLFAQLKGRWI